MARTFNAIFELCPKGWDEDLVKRILDHCENQTEDEAVAKDEAAWEEYKQRNRQKR